MLLKINLGINFRLTMAPNIPQCTLKMLVIQPGPPFHSNEVQIVKNGIQQAKSCPVMIDFFSKTAYFDTIYFCERPANVLE